MSKSTVENKRIIKNTLFLYFQMIFKTIVGLYTSSVVLNVLGVEDFGIYSVVGGIVIMLGVINTPMAAATARFFTFGLARNDKEEQLKIFSTAWRIHLLIAGLFVILVEIIGLWFLYGKAQIPEARMSASFWAFQCSSLVMAVSIMSTPYNAVIIAHEKMSAFAYISIMETCLKLFVVYLLQNIQVDKLILYAVLIVLVQFIVMECYVFYCKYRFVETKSLAGWDRKLFREMFGFAGWDLYGNFCSVGKMQGSNMLLNLFFGTVYNAAFGIAGQVQNAIMQFANNVVVAVRPQIIKSYSLGNYERMNMLIYRGTIFISLLLLTISMPVVVETPYLLELWLKNVPDSAVSFCRLSLLSNIFIPATMLLGAGIHATGKIKWLSLFTGSIYLSVLPLSWVGFQLGEPPEMAFTLNVALTFIGVISNAWILHRQVQAFPLMLFIWKVVIIVLLISLLYIGVLHGVAELMQPSFVRLVTVCFFSLVLLLAIGLFMMRDDEKSFLFHKIKNT